MAPGSSLLRMDAETPSLRANGSRSVTVALSAEMFSRRRTSRGSRPAATAALSMIALLAAT